jgi:hypothetical protein
VINRINIIVAEVRSEKTRRGIGKQFGTSFHGEHGMLLIEILK